jgi:2-iminoacetate synthase
MGFESILSKYEDGPADIFPDASERDVARAASKDCPDERDFAALLSPAAKTMLEPLAQKAHSLTLRHFGRTVLIYAPLYLADYCDNRCRYCCFNGERGGERKKLSQDEIKRETAALASLGIGHVIVLTGDNRLHTPPRYLEDALKIITPHFASVAIEVPSMDTDDYKRMIAAGADGFTMFQETYDRKIYADVHPSGPKRNFLYRLDAPERAATAGMRLINIGALLGLAPWRREVFLTGLHALYLQDKFPSCDITVSLPRLRLSHTGFESYAQPMQDADMVQSIIALRLFLPHVGINISTRETAWFRDNILPLGITKMSAASSTSVGGYAVHKTTGNGQFEVGDERSLPEIKTMLAAKGYYPVLKDWIGAQNP